MSIRETKCTRARASKVIEGNQSEMQALREQTTMIINSAFPAAACKRIHEPETCWKLAFILLRIATDLYDGKLGTGSMALDGDKTSFRLILGTRKSHSSSRASRAHIHDK